MMKEKKDYWTVLIILFFLTNTNIVAQIAPDTLWTRTFGGIGDDYGYSIIQSSDSGYIITGDYNAQYVNNIGDIYLIKINQYGDTIWTETYGGTFGDYGLDVLETKNSEYAITGYTHSFGNHNRDAHLLKINSNSDLLWMRTYGIFNWNASHSIHQTTDQGFILAGENSMFGSANNCYIIRTDSTGNVVWERMYGGNDTEWADHAFQLPNGDFLISGTTNSFGQGGFDFYLLRINSNGDTLWTKTYGGSNDDWTSTSLLTPDNGIIIGGATSSFGNGQEDVYLIRADENGDTLWTKAYGGTGIEWVSSIFQLSNEDFIIVGETNSFGYGNNDVYLLRINSNGDTLWTQTFGGTNNDCGRSVLQTENGGYLISGYSSSFGSGDYDVYLIQTQPDPINEIIEDQYKIFPGEIFIAQNYPNPFNPITTIKYQLPEATKVVLRIYNVLGQEVRTLVNEYQLAGFNSVVWDGRDHSSRIVSTGVYIYKMIVKNKIYSRKMLILK